jgi:HprK-related kinase B
MMYGVPKQPRINPGTVVNNPSLSRVMPASERSAVRELPRDELWQLEQKYDVMIEEVFGSDRFILHSPISALFILNWHHDAGPTHVAEMNLSNRRDLLRAFIKKLGLFFDPRLSQEHPDQSDESYLALLSKCRVFEICGSIDFDYAARAALEVLHDD